MAVIRIQGLTDWQARLDALEDKADEVCAKAVAAGAGIIADEVRRELEAIPVDEHWGTPNNPIHGLKRIQKEGLLEALGITPMKRDGNFINVKVGFDGYNRERTRRWPNGKPNLMIARSLESGTSFSRKIRFFYRAVEKSEEQALRKMEEVAKEEIDRIMGGR